MSSSQAPNPPLPADVSLPSQLYSCRHLFPADLTSTRPTWSTRVWQGVSAVTVSSVGVISRVWLRYLNSVRIHNRERLVEVLEHRPPHVPVITVANHHSCMDEPLIWGILDFKHLTNPYLMRWALAAHDICFTKKLHAQFFAYGKSIPIVRGEGVYQGGMNFCVERLNEGRWIHLYPEGKVNVTKDIDLRLKWGVGRLISDCQELPIVIPIYHYGMDDILPNSKPYIPRIRQKVTVNVGEPINLEETMRDLKARNADAQERRRVITDVIQEAVRKLKKNTEILHARNTFKPN